MQSLFKFKVIFISFFIIQIFVGTIDMYLINLISHSLTHYLCPLINEEIIKTKDTVRMEAATVRRKTVTEEKKKHFVKHESGTYYDGVQK